MTVERLHLLLCHLPSLSHGDIGPIEIDVIHIGRDH